MKDLLYTLNKTPGSLGSAYIDEATVVHDFGEALGGVSALPLAKRAADACKNWMWTSGETMESAVFVGIAGRIVACPAGAGMLVAFTENDASAGMLKLRMRDAAEQIRLRQNQACATG